MVEGRRHEVIPIYFFTGVRSQIVLFECKSSFFLKKKEWMGFQTSDIAAKSKKLRQGVLEAWSWCNGVESAETRAFRPVPAAR